MRALTHSYEPSAYVSITVVRPVCIETYRYILQYYIRKWDFRKILDFMNTLLSLIVRRDWLRFVNIQRVVVSHEEQHGGHSQGSPSLLYLFTNTRGSLVVYRAFRINKLTILVASKPCSSSC
ncbi:unnamed protein product [Boreogadus saida]